MSKSVPQLGALSELSDTDLLHVVSNSIDYKMTVSDFRTALNYASPKIYDVLLDQAAPFTGLTASTTVVGRIYTVATYDAGDTFVGQETISGTVNTSGYVFRALTAIGWTNSQLDYDGAPYVVSTDSSDTVNPFINTLGGTPVWSYISTGYYAMTLAAAFPENKVSIYAVEAVPPVAGRTYECETAWWDADSIRLKTVRVVDGTTRTPTDVCLFKTSLRILVYP